jgi:hypothetical protein
MPREIKTAEEITNTMQGWLASSDAMNGRCRGCGPPLPIRLPMANVSGCNWAVIGFPNLIPGCAAPVQDVVAPARRISNYPIPNCYVSGCGENPR